MCFLQVSSELERSNSDERSAAHRRAMSLIFLELTAIGSAQAHSDASFFLACNWVKSIESCQEACVASVMMPRLDQGSLMAEH